jgi:hypothetical protein
MNGTPHRHRLLELNGVAMSNSAALSGPCLRISGQGLRRGPFATGGEDVLDLGRCS